MLGREFYKAVEAFEFAAKYHVGIRKDGFTPTFHHQVSIGHYLRTLPNLRNLELVLTVAVLHDILEDSDLVAGDLERRFGSEVSNAVVRLTRKKNGIRKSNEEYYSQMIECPVSSVVKGGDRIHNFQTMPQVFTCTKQLNYIKECEEFMLPMLRDARNHFPDQELAYENIKHALKGQIELLRLSISAQMKINELRETLSKKVSGAQDG